MRSLLIPGVLLGCLVVGCEKSEQTTPAANAPATTMPTGETANTPAVETPTTPAAESTAAPSAEAPATPTAAEAKEAATTNPMVAAAEKKLAEATQYIKDNKYDLAEKALNEVEANKASLPASVQTQLGRVRSALDAAKAAAGAKNAAGGIKLPGAAQ
jgi:hypothetical protein